MESPVAFVLILATITFATAPANSQNISASQNPIPVGSDVTLSSRVHVTLGGWLSDNGFIVFILTASQTIFPPWTDRVTYNASTSALTIRSVQLEDSGLYTLQSGQNNFRGHLNLSVQVPISSVSLSASATNLVEFNSTVVLMCAVADGTSLKFVWLMNNTEVQAGENYQLSEDGANLTIVEVKRHNEGPFRCNVSNGISQGISNPVMLNISYGPSHQMLTAMPMKYAYRTGSNITLSCSAQSKPPAMIQWMVDGEKINNEGRYLHLERVKKDNSGDYQCLFHNTVTMRFSTASTIIRIMEPLVSVEVSHTGGLAVLHEPFTLHCKVNGTASSIHWSKNDAPIYADNATVLEMGNKTLMLPQVQLSDKGMYQCHASNAVSNMTSSAYMVEVNYGPEEPVIEGPYMALAGKPVTFNCSSASHPPSHFSWYFHEELLATTSELKIEHLTVNMSGKYICMAFNNVTGKNSSAYKMLTVWAPVTMTKIKTDGAKTVLNHTFTLTCKADGNVQSIIWHHNGSLLHPGYNRNLSMDNATLTFEPVMMSDSGNYQCVASNALSSLASEMFMLDVYYGPKMATIMGPKAAKAGDNVTFSCIATSNPPSSYKWLHNGYPVHVTTAEYVTPPLTVAMSGTYTCVAYNNATGQNSTAYTMLTVIDPITYMQVEAPTYPAIEGHHYMLTCNVTGVAEHVYWMKNNESLHDDNSTHFYMMNMSIKSDALKRDDSGSYKCKAGNALGNMTSPPHMLYVNYGPEKPTIHGPDYAETGSSVYFNCSAESHPLSHFSWMFNGTEVTNTSTFKTHPLSLNMSGEYTCKAYNSVTGKNSTYSKMLTVVEAIKSVRIQKDSIPIASKNFTLTCEVDGPYDSIYWTINNMNHSATHSPNMSYHTLKNMLLFTPVTTYDDGMYRCVATNKANKHQSPPYELLVNFGPLNVTITGPASAKQGVTVTMKCTAASRPNSTFSWFINSLDSPVVHNGPVILLPAAVNANILCEARNPLTQMKMHQVKTFTVDAGVLHIPSQGAVMLMGLLAVSVAGLFH